MRQLGGSNGGTAKKRHWELALGTLGENKHEIFRRKLALGLKPGNGYQQALTFLPQNTYSSSHLHVLAQFQK